MSYRIRTSAYRALLLSLGVLLLSGAASWLPGSTVVAAQVQSHPTLASDKRDYVPGDIVNLAGSGFKPGELVTIVMSVNPITHADVTLTSVADANGNFKNSDYLVQKTDLGVTFHVQAVGSFGDTAPQLTFTDTIGAPTSIGTGARSSTGSVGTFATTVTAAVPVGNTVIVSALVSVAASSTITMTDSAGNTYSKDADVTSTTGPTRTVIFSAPVTTALASGGTITINSTTTTRYYFVSAFQVSGLVSASRVDQTKTATGTNSAVSTGATGTTAQGDELLFAAFGDDINSGSPTLTAGSGFTALTTSVTSAVYGIYPEYQIANTTGAYTATGTFSATPLAWAGAIVTYKALPGSKLVFTTSPLTVTAGACSPAISVQSQDTNNTAASPLTTETVALSTSGTGGVFYSDAACSTVITSVTIATTADTTTFYWADSVSGTPVITASGTGAYTSAPTQTETVIVNPTPTITTLSPSSAIAGASAQTLTINGNGFVTNSSATYNGVAHAVTYVSATQITIPLSAADLATAGTYPVVVTNPAPGGGSSAPANFQINNPVPAITTFTPTSIIMGTGAQTLTINGTGFTTGSTVTYNSVAHTATFVSTIKLTISLTAADVAVAGSYPVQVTNPAPGGGTSAVSNFPVNNPVPTVTTLSPASATVGTAAQTLTINGTNFLPISTATYGGSARTVTYISGTQITIPLSATDQATAGNFPVVVTNPAPGGGSSTAVNFVVQNLVPTITSLSPTSANQGSAAQTLTINGTNFLPTSTATYNGASPAHTFTYISATQGTIPLTAADQATAGNINVIVSNPTPGGGPSTAAVFTVNNNAPTVTTLTPSSSNVGSAATTVTITGTGFVSTSTATFNGVAHTVTFTNSTTIKITLSVTDQAVAGTYPVVVTNPAPGGGSSTPVNYTVNNLAPTVTTISPTSAATGSAAQTLTINGTNFNASSTVSYNGVSHTATLVSATKLTILLSAADQATAGTYPVVVTNPPPAGGSSAAVNFVVGTPPAITSGNAATFVSGTFGSFQITATGNPAPTFTATGTIPDGLTLSSSGLLSGTAVGGQTQVVTVTATNGVSPNATQSLTIQVNEQPFINPAPSSISGTVGSPISLQFTLQIGTPSTATWTETGALPTGITLSTSGLLSGTSTQIGTFPIVVQADNGVPPAATENFTITINRATKTATYTQTFDTAWNYQQVSCSGTAANCKSGGTATNCQAGNCVFASAQTPGLTAVTQTGYFYSSFMWTQLNVPAGATVVSVDGSWWDEASTYSFIGTHSACSSGSAAGIQIYDAQVNGNQVTAAAVEPIIDISGDNSGATHGNLGAQAVLPQYQSASTPVWIRFNVNQIGVILETCTVTGDTLTLTIGYIPKNQTQVIFAKAVIDRFGHLVNPITSYKTGGGL